MDLTEEQEMYAQLRASGYTKSGAASKAYNTKYPKQLGHNTEKIEKVSERIMQLREERAEAANITVEEQLRRYNELYTLAIDKGNLGLAKQMLERIDAILGFQAPNKSISLSVRQQGEVSNEILKGDNIEKDLEKFAGIVKKHSTNLGTSTH